MPGAKRSFFTTLRVVSTFLGGKETGRERKTGRERRKVKRKRGKEGKLTVMSDTSTLCVQ